MSAKPQFDYPNSYYAATINDPDTRFDPLTDTVESEVCVIGGGYAGLMTALGLIERGITNVTIVEQHRVGWGASGRNGGFVFGGYSLGPQALVKQVGLQAARDLYQLTLDAVNLIRKRITHYQINCDLVDEGVIWANWFKDQSVLIQQADFMQEKMGVDWEYLSPEALKTKLKTERYHGGLFEPNAMHFHPLNYARGIAREIAGRGGKLFENSKVVSINSDGGSHTVITENGKINCKHVVLTGGGYFKGLLPRVSHSVLPIATYVMATEPLNERLISCFNTRAAVYDTRFAFDYYRPLQDSRILWGGRVSANTKEPRDLSQLLKNDMLKVFPELSDVNVDYAWEGWMSYARHQMAQIGQVAPNVWYGVGFGGHGVAPTTVAGEILAQAITNENNAWKNFKPWGLPWNGGPFGPIAAQINYWWFQTKDWLKERMERE